jgi:hypothetical protein
MNVRNWLRDCTLWEFRGVTDRWEFIETLICIQISLLSDQFSFSLHKDLFCWAECWEIKFTSNFPALLDIILCKWTWIWGFWISGELHCVAALLISNVLKEFLDLSILEDKCSTLICYVGINNSTIECNIQQELNLQWQQWKPQLAHLTWIFLFLAKNSNFRVNLINLSLWKPYLPFC